MKQFYKKYIIIMVLSLFIFIIGCNLGEEYNTTWDVTINEKKYFDVKFSIINGGTAIEIKYIKQKPIIFHISEIMSVVIIRRNK